MEWMVEKARHGNGLCKIGMGLTGQSGLLDDIYHLKIAYIYFSKCLLIRWSHVFMFVRRLGSNCC